MRANPRVVTIWPNAGLVMSLLVVPAKCGVPVRFGRCTAGPKSPRFEADGLVTYAETGGPLLSSVTAAALQPPSTQRSAWLRDGPGILTMGASTMRCGVSMILRAYSGARS